MMGVLWKAFNQNNFQFPISGLWVLNRLGPAQAPARQLGTTARACLADGSRNAAMFSAAQQKPKNSERDCGFQLAMLKCLPKMTVHVLPSLATRRVVAFGSPKCDFFLKQFGLINGPNIHIELMFDDVY